MSPLLKYYNEITSSISKCVLVILLYEMQVILDGEYCTSKEDYIRNRTKLRLFLCQCKLTEHHV